MSRSESHIEDRVPPDKSNIMSGFDPGTSTGSSNSQSSNRETLPLHTNVLRSSAGTNESKVCNTAISLNKPTLSTTITTTTNTTTLSTTTTTAATNTTTLSTAATTTATTNTNTMTRNEADRSIQSSMIGSITEPLTLVQRADPSRACLSGIPAENKDKMIAFQRQEICILQGKLKGYQTLTDLHHQSKQECVQIKGENERIRNELQELKEKFNQLVNQQSEMNNSQQLQQLTQQSTASIQQPAAAISTIPLNSVSELNTTNSDILKSNSEQSKDTMTNTINNQGSEITNNSNNFEIIDDKANSISDQTEFHKDSDIEMVQVKLPDSSDSLKDEQKDPRETDVITLKYFQTSVSDPELKSMDLCDLREVEEGKGSGKQTLSPESSQGSSSFVRISSEDTTMNSGKSELDLIHMGFDDLAIVKKKSESSSSRPDPPASAPPEVSTDLKLITVKAENLEKYCLEQQAVINKLNEEISKGKKGSKAESESSYDMIRQLSNSDIKSTNQVQAAAAAVSHQSSRAGSAAEIVNNASSPAAVVNNTAAAEKVAMTSQPHQDLKLKSAYESSHSQHLVNEMSALKSALQQEKQKVSDMECEIRRLSDKNRQLEIELSHSYQEQMNPEYNHGCAYHSHYQQESHGHQSDKDYLINSQIQLLKQQVRIFKEDFDQERRDRELAKAEADDYKKQIIALNTKLQAVQYAHDKSEEELQKMCNKNKKLEAYCSKLSKSLQDYVRNYSESGSLTGLASGSSVSKSSASRARLGDYHVKSEELTSSTTRSTMGKTGSSPRKQSSSDGWPCPACTFINHAESRKCSLCGKIRPETYKYQHGHDSACQQQQQQEDLMELVARSDVPDKKFQRTFSNVTIDHK